MKEHALDPVDHLIAQVGISMVQTVQAYYQKYCEKPNAANAKQYITWRFRLHQKLKNDRITLDAINDSQKLGLYDEKPGKTFWDIEF